MIRLILISFVIAIWCMVTASQPVFLGTLRPIFHETRGKLYAIDEKTFFIQNFEYDGQGLAVYIYVYLTGQTVSRRGGGTILYWTPTRVAVPQRRFRSENITIALNASASTAKLNISNIKTFTVWCQPFAVFFTRLDLPANVKIPPIADSTEPPVMPSTKPPVMPSTKPPVIPSTKPPVMPSTKPPVMPPSCFQLHSDFQVSWTHTDSHIKIKQCGCIDEDQYMAFGISGSDTSTHMVGADVVVTWINDDGPNAIDYHLAARQQCRAGQGVCPDTMISGGGGSQDTFNVSGSIVNGTRCIEYARSLNTNDSNDRPYLVNSQTQFVAWAYGPRATEENLRDLAFFHTEYPNGVDVQLNFAQSMQCSEPLQCIKETVCDWKGLSITATEPTTFMVKIGLSGGQRGYQAITGLSSWGIAFYINDTLIPVLKLRRNVAYTFIVEAGNDPENAPSYHPFYITSSKDGGILLDTAKDRMRKKEQVYAGFDVENNRPTAAGRLCEYFETNKSASVAEDCDSELQEYLDTLDVRCQGDESDAAILTWTPDNDTPDVVYYQCANHLHLGWKIELDTDMDKPTDTGCTIEGQKFTKCGTKCPPTCSEPKPSMCASQCVMGCQCRRGTVLDEIQNKCVKAKNCTCPPTCSHEYCNKKGNKNKPCSRPPPHATPACPDQCRTTYCSACYYSKSPQNTPQKCEKRACKDQAVTPACHKRWARCVHKKNLESNECKDDCITAENFRCYDFPACM